MCYVDADFAGGWSKEDATDPDNVLSRTGFVIFFSRLSYDVGNLMQIEISLSTAESEYVACSMAIQDVLSLMQLMREIDKILQSTKQNQ